MVHTCKKRKIPLLERILSMTLFRVWRLTIAIHKSAMSANLRKKVAKMSIKDFYFLYRETCKEMGKAKADRLLKSFKKQIRRQQKAMFNPAIVSMRDGWKRFYHSPDGDCWTDVSIFERGSSEYALSQNDWTMKLWHSINSPYDCTGKAFSRFVYVHRNQYCSIVMHGMAIDC